MSEPPIESQVGTAPDEAGARPDSGMRTGMDAGTPGERGVAADDIEAAVLDDAPLVPERPQGGGDQGDGLAPPFHEPEG